LYISGLGEVLQDTKLGIELGAEILTGLFFADDLVLISRTWNRGMNSLLRILDRFCSKMSMTLSVSKTFVLTTGPKDKTWKIGDSGEELKETLVAKYLGINLQLRGRHTLGREQDITGIARRYAHTILSITRGGLDRSRLAKILWETCAVPAFLYGTEAMPIGSNTVIALEKIQTMVGKFILQVPGSTSKVAAWCDAGLMPIQYRIWKRKAVFLWKLIFRNEDALMQEGLRDIISVGGEDPWVQEISTIEAALGKSITRFTLKELKSRISHVASLAVLDIKREHDSVSSLPQPRTWFVLQPHVNDSWYSKILNMTRAGNMRLGNRMKNRKDIQVKYCPWCEAQSIRVRLNESHLILSCGGVKEERTKEGVQAYFRRHSGKMANHLVLRMYLGQDGSKPDALRLRGATIHRIVEAWFNRI